MRSFRLMLFIAVIWEHFKRSFGSLWIFGFRIFIRSILCAQHFFSLFASFSKRKTQSNENRCVKICKFASLLFDFCPFLRFVFRLFAMRCRNLTSQLFDLQLSSERDTKWNKENEQEIFWR